mgnify:CR=1 FL=1
MRNRLPSGPLAVAIAFILGACTGTAAYTAATQSPTRGAGASAVALPGIPPAQASGVPTVVALQDTEQRQVGGGKASVRFLAHGAQAWLGKLEMAAGGKVPLHRDATEEYIHVLAGGGVITIDGKVSTIGPGTTVFMPAGAQVTYQNGPARLVALQVFAGPAPAAKYNRWQKVAQ